MGRQVVKDKTNESQANKTGRPSASTSGPVNAEVQQLVGRTGARGEITQVMCTIISGSSTGRTLRRNVFGPVKLGDLLTLREVDIEARKIRTNTRRSV